MTCKDCVHYEVCMDFTTLKESEFCQNYDKQEDLCDYFKNKADVVEVVRCKDCACSRRLQDTENNKTIFRFCLIDGDFVSDNNYCGMGERRCGE